MHAGRVDVEEMLDEIDPQILRELYALSVIDGWGEDWWRAGTIAAVVHNACQQVVRAALGDDSVEIWDMMPEDSIPKLPSEVKKRKGDMAKQPSSHYRVDATSDEFARRLNRMAGY